MKEKKWSMFPCAYARLSMRSAVSLLLAGSLTMCQGKEKAPASPSKAVENLGAAGAGSDSSESPSGKVGHGKANRLLREKSPYLLQHAYNPVDWHPWGPAAFAEAKKRDLPIFLSIGYSTCHWCHVMEKESFEDGDVAKLMNENFISIKVDREERPDVDNVYMTVAQMMTGSGGWPLTILMTPDKMPFHAATYIPKESRFGRMGMMELLPRVTQIWKTKRLDIEKSASEITGTLARQIPGGSPGRELGIVELKLAYEQLRNRYDSERGGFGESPKFPTPHNLLFLMRHWKRTGEAPALEMVEKTLHAMRAGGMYDQVGFGFHRYSTDKDWFLPHFEKMLYDQAMLAMAYTEAYQATGKESYARTAREILTYVLRDMTHAEGGFYSAEDADSEGEEGKFYLWSVQEIRGILNKTDADWVVKTFRIEDKGNYHEEAGGVATGHNIFSLAKPLSRSGDLKRWDGIRKQLFEVREKRIHPLKDDKVLTDWNGLMIAAMAMAGTVLGAPEYVKSAERAAGFVLSKLRKADGTLIHRFREGEAALAPHLEDYAFMVWGLLELYESTFDVKYLEAALDIHRIQVRSFWDDKAGGFFFTAADGEKLLVRSKEAYDGAIPSGNSVSMFNLLRLGRITGEAGMEQMASKLGRVFSVSVGQSPSAHTLMMSALDFAVGPSFEVVISGDPSGKDTEAMLGALRREFQPRKVVVFRPAGEDEPAITKLAKYTLTQTPVKGKATAYVCRNYVCNFPTNDPAKMVGYLKSPEPAGK